MKSLEPRNSDEPRLIAVTRQAFGVSGQPVEQPAELDIRHPLVRQAADERSLPAARLGSVLGHVGRLIPGQDRADGVQIGDLAQAPLEIGEQRLLRPSRVCASAHRRHLQQLGNAAPRQRRIAERPNVRRLIAFYTTAGELAETAGFVERRRAGILKSILPQRKVHSGGSDRRPLRLAPRASERHHLPFDRQRTMLRDPDGGDAPQYQRGDNGPAVVPFQGKQSRLYKLAAHLEDPHMPPKSPRLSDEQLNLLLTWIDLGAAYDQLLRYREGLDNPPLLVVCDLERFEVHTNFTGTAKRVYRFTLADLANASLIPGARYEPQVLALPGSFPRAIGDAKWLAISTLFARLEFRSGFEFDGLVRRRV